MACSTLVVRIRYFGGRGGAGLGRQSEQLVFLGTLQPPRSGSVLAWLLAWWMNAMQSSPGGAEG